MTLWEGDGASPDRAVLTFTSMDDPVLDRELLPFDCLASAAHAQMLAEVGLLEAGELRALRDALADAYARSRRGELEIRPQDEDGHTALEMFLTERTGEAGRRIHTGRSRNDQVIAALRLWVRERGLELAERTAGVVDELLARADRHRADSMPGYTHTRQAMPSTVGQLFGAVAEDLLGDLETWRVSWGLAQRGALGSASGYGVPLPLRRERTAELLGLSDCDVNTLHVQNTRGRLESAALFAMHQTSLSLARFASDCIAFSSEAFGFFRLPDALTTGSSIMPQKRNPDVLELLRAMPSAFLGRYTEVTAILPALGAGYHRDLQRTKGPLLRGAAELRDALLITRELVSGIEVDAAACEAALRPEIYATDRALALVAQGVPFREAYRRVKGEPPVALDLAQVRAARTHLGAPGTEMVTRLRAQLHTWRESLVPLQAGVAKAQALLAGSP